MKTKKLLIAGLLFSGLMIGMGSKSASGTASSEDSSTPLPGARVSSRARGKALQTDKFPRPPERAVSETTQPKTKY